MRRVLVIALVFAAAVCGLVGWVSWPRSHSLSEKNLTFANVQVATLRDVVSATGVVEPREIVLIGSEMPGTVTRLLARANDQVTEGAELGQLDDRKLTLKLQEAKNGVQIAEAAVGQ